MTQREWRRQHLIWTIRMWMRRQGGFLVFAAFSLTISQTTWLPLALAANETKADAIEKTTLISRLMSKEPTTAKPAPAKPAAVKKVAKKPDLQLNSMTDEDKKAEGEIKTIRGRVSGVNNFGIAVEYDDGSSEMWADLLKETKLDGFKKMKDLQYGDTVEISYKELKESHKRLLQKVSFIHKKPQEHESLAAEEKEAS